MIKNCTSREESIRLLELGVIPETADKYYFLDPTPAGNIYHLVDISVESGIRNLPEFKEGDIPCWSLSALLNLIPKDRKIELLSWEDKFSTSGPRFGWIAQDISFTSGFKSTPFDAVYTLVCLWLTGGKL